MKDYSILNQPYQIAGLTVKNRYVMAPVSTGLYMGEDGAYSDMGVEYFACRARGGFGIIIPGAVGTDATVDPYSPVGPTPIQVGEAWKVGAKKLTAAVHEAGSAIFCQLTLGLGRNYPMLPSCSENEVWANPGVMSPVLTVEQIKEKIAQFIETAKIVKECGYDGIEVHAMHWGYLLDQFAMACFNRRTDEYGGTWENRLRAAREILEGVKKVCGKDFPVGMRIGLQTFIKGVNQATLTGEGEIGRTLEESILCCKLLEQYGYDFLNVDVGVYDSFYYACPPVYMPQNFMIDMAAKAKAAVSIPVMVGGRMQDPDAAAEAITAGKFDAVTLGRPALADPELPNKVIAGTPERVRPCIGCNLGCYNRGLVEMAGAQCALNPECSMELVKSLKPAETKKKVVVVGGGVGGMETARVAALRGHDVTLIEKTDKLGGHLLEAGSHSFKKEVKQLNEWYQRELKELDVTIEMNREVCAKCLKDMEADAIVLATGSVPSMPPIEGLEKAIVSVDAIRNPEQLGHKVVIVGGGLVGCELAYDEAKQGKEVVIVEALEKILSAGMPAPLPNAQMLGDLFAYHNVTILAGHKLVKVTDTGVVLENAEGTVEVTADSVVNAMGFKPGKSLKEELEGIGAAVYEIGDAKAAKTIMAAIWDGYDVASNI